MARYSSSLVSMGKTQFGLGTTGSMAGILQVSTFQLEALYLIMGGKRKQKRLISTNPNAFTADCYSHTIKIMFLVIGLHIYT